MKNIMKLKLNVAIAILLMSSKIAFAQFNTAPDVKNKWGASIAINSIQAQVEIPIMTGIGTEAVDADGNILSGGKRKDKSYSCSIIPKYYLNNDILLRFEIGITNLNLAASYDSKEGFTHTVSNTEIGSKIFRYTPGFQWIFMKTKRIESYCGMIASYISYKSINENVYSEQRDLATDTVQVWTKDKVTTPGGFAIGIGALAGFNIYLHKRISIGAEFSSSALYYIFGGDTTEEVSQRNLPNPISTNTNTYTNSYKGFKITKVISSFNITVWF